MLGRYYVLPDVVGAFEKAWSELLRATRHEELAGNKRGGGGGVVVNLLFRHGDSNVHWLTYTLFDSHRWVGAAEAAAFSTCGRVHATRACDCMRAPAHCPTSSAAACCFLGCVPRGAGAGVGCVALDSIAFYSYTEHADRKSVV